MKRIFFYALIGLLILALSYAALAKSTEEGLSTLIIHSEEGGAHIYIDGRLRGKMIVTEHDVTVTGIEPGKHNVRVTDFTELEIWWEGIVDIPEGFTARAAAEPGQFLIYNMPQAVPKPSTPIDAPPQMVGKIEVRSDDPRPLSILIDMREVGTVGAGSVLGPIELAAGEHYLRAIDPTTGGLICSGLIDVRPGSTLTLLAMRGRPLSSPSRPRAVIPGF